MALPDELQAIVPAVSAEMSGGILGREAPGDDRTAALATVALMLCHRYAPAAPIEIVQEAAVARRRLVDGPTAARRRSPREDAGWHRKRAHVPLGGDGERAERESGAETDARRRGRSRHARAIG